VNDGPEIQHRSPPDVRDYAQIIWRRKWWVVLAVVVVAGGSLILARRQTKTYTATAEVLTAAPGGKVEPTAMATDEAILQSAPVQALARQYIPLTGTVDVGPKGVSGVMLVTATSGTASVAVQRANAWANAYVEYTQGQEKAAATAPVQQIQQQIASLQQQASALDAQLQSSTAAILAQGTTANGGGQGQTLALDQLQAAIVPRRNALVDQEVSLQVQLLGLKIATASAALTPTVLTQAALPAVPKPTKTVQTGVLGLGGGLLLGVVLAFLFEYLDDSIATRDQLDGELAGTPVLAAIPEFRRRSEPRPGTITLTKYSSAAAEPYRALRTALDFVGAVPPSGVLHVASLSAGEGSSTTAANLAVLLARAGRRVVLVDADLRNGALTSIFGLSDPVGLTSVMIGDVTIDEALQPVSGVERLSVLTTGPVPPNPAELLASSRFADVVASLRRDGAVVVVDSAPLSSVTEGLVVAASAQAVALVVSARVGTRKRVRRALTLLRQANAPLVGAVLNRTHAEPITQDTRKWRESERVAPRSSEGLARA